MSWLMSKIYDRMMKGVEQKHISAWRRASLSKVKGEVLEIGAGTGANLGHYPPNLKRLVLSEPDSHMRSILEKKVSTESLPAEVIWAKAESLPFDDQSFDWVVCTLVLCSVKDLTKSLQEFHRVLRPGGGLAFVEHVSDLEDPVNHRRQKRWQPVWGFFTQHCQVTQNTEAALGESGFDVTHLHRERMEMGPQIIRPVIRGYAIRE